MTELAGEQILAGATAIYAGYDVDDREQHGDHAGDGRRAGPAGGRER